MTNKEKFLALVTDDENDTLKNIRYRVENREEIRKQKRKELDRIDKEKRLNK